MSSAANPRRERDKIMMRAKPSSVNPLMPLQRVKHDEIKMKKTGRALLKWDAGPPGLGVGRSGEW